MIKYRTFHITINSSTFKAEVIAKSLFIRNNVLIKKKLSLQAYLQKHQQSVQKYIELSSFQNLKQMNKSIKLHCNTIQQECRFNKKNHTRTFLIEQYDILDCRMKIRTSMSCFEIRCIIFDISYLFKRFYKRILLIHEMQLFENCLHYLVSIFMHYKYEKYYTISYSFFLFKQKYLSNR